MHTFGFHTTSHLSIEGVAWGLPGGWLGVGWGFRGPQPSKPPANPLETPCILPANALYTANRRKSGSISIQSESKLTIAIGKYELDYQYTVFETDSY